MRKTPQRIFVAGHRGMVGSAIVRHLTAGATADTLTIVTRTHAELDATLFTRIAAALNLTRRYVGEEPFSHTTSLYNEALAEVLPKAGIELAVIPRAQAQGEAISASHVRQLIHDGQIEDIRPLVPETTYAYLTSDAGQNAVKRIQASDDVIHH